MAMAVGLILSACGDDDPRANPDPAVVREATDEFGPFAAKWCSALSIADADIIDQANRDELYEIGRELGIKTIETIERRYPELDPEETLLAATRSYSDCEDYTDAQILDPLTDDEEN